MRATIAHLMKSRFAWRLDVLTWAREGEEHRGFLTVGKWSAFHCAPYCFHLRLFGREIR